MKRNLVLFAILLFVEISIALFEFHPIIRGLFGDVLAIPLVYFLLRSVLKISSESAIILALFIAFGIEFLQWLNIIEFFKITWKPLKIILGTSFDPKDLFAYLIGGAITFLFEYKFRKKEET